MRKVLLLCFLSLGVVGAAWGDWIDTGFRPRPPLETLPDIGFVPRQPVIMLPATPPADHYRVICKSKVEIKGVLDTKKMPAERRPFPETYLDFLLTGLDGTITVDGKLYQLDFGTSAALRDQARRLSGKRVILQGNVDRRRLPLDLIHESGASRELLCNVEYILVASIEEVDESIREAVEVDAQGRLDVDAMLGFDGTTGPVLRVKGVTYVLDLSTCGMPLSFAKWDGRTVRVTARLGEWKSYVGPMIPKSKAPRYRVLHVQEFNLVQESYIKHGEQVELGGPLQYYRHIRFGRGAVAIVVAGNAYWLDFGANDALYALAQKLSGDGRRVRILGNLRASDGAIEVTGVEALEAAEHYRESVSVEIRGILQEAPRPDGLPELMIYPPHRTLQVNVHGRVLTLEFPLHRGLYCSAFEMVGAHVIIRGRLEGNTVQVMHIQPTMLDELLVPYLAVR